MRIVLGFVLVSLVVGFVAWLVSGRSATVPAMRTEPRPDLTLPDAPVADVIRDGFDAGFLDRHFGGEAPAATGGPAAALEGGASPGPTYVIKGNATSRIFHVPGSASYARTKAEIWFETEEQAIEAGYRAPKGRAPRSQ